MHKLLKLRFVPNGRICLHVSRYISTTIGCLNLNGFMHISAGLCIKLRQIYIFFKDFTRLTANSDRLKVSNMTSFEESVRFKYRQRTVPPFSIKSENQTAVPRKQAFVLDTKTIRNHLYSTRNEKNFTSKSKDNLKSGARCILCSLLGEKADKKIWEKEKPVALLSIIGGSDEYLPTETIRNQLKSGLLAIMKTINIWIITEGSKTGVAVIVKEVIQGNIGKSIPHVFHRDSSITHEDRNTGQAETTSVEDCILDHIKIPLIMIIVGGEQDSFEIAMSNLEKKVPVLVIDGSGSAADFISKGYRMSTHKKSEEKTLFYDTFKSEMTDAAKSIFTSNDEQNTSDSSCEILAEQLHNGLEINRKCIYVHSVNDTTYTLERTIQDILFQLFCEDTKNSLQLQRSILRFVNLWNRPDIAEKEIFNLENRKVLKILQEELCTKSSLAELFKNSLVSDRVDMVRLVLEFIPVKELYEKFLNIHIKDLYKDTGNITGHLIGKDASTEKNIVVRINEAVIKILGSKEMKPFSADAEKEGIRDKDIFKHLFIWSVLMNRKELAMLFWKKEDKDFICSALYASSLAKKLAENASVEAYTDQQAAFWESHRYYEDLAYSVMTEMYFEDKTQARQLLVTEVESYNFTTIFEITENSTLMKFMGHAACQTQMNKIWKGCILSDTSNLKAITAAFIPILILNIVNIEDGQHGKSDVSKTPEQENNSNGTSPQTPIEWGKLMRKLYYFYNSPLVKFFFFVVSYMAMLVIFSIFVLTDLYPMSEKYPSVKEWIVYVWAASTLTEEIRQAVVIKQLSLNTMTWFTFWTLYEILMYCLFITSVFMRLTLKAEDFYHARMMYSLTLGIFIINSMQFFLVSKHIGTKVIMIGRMMFDIFFFILIFAVFVFGFGIIYQATMYPNSILGYHLFKEIIYMPYWQLYGELFLENFEEKDPST
ncbi:transient receptor potential cation channel subfamily M member-like 2 isoform X2 [Mytilus californianus]|uniref:transient receptor potential cation channel subfamily M member-like 2 isoform X2 n=1 Tax=Mytilus californianus TaxID=6549 RepID=UPI002246454D|nr:transient receptor potential cation channel subfamily M member-like 2 isoform X2 [Mytilus californianus]